MPQLPPKLHGQHRWVSVITRHLSRTDLGMMTEEVRVAEEDAAVSRHLALQHDVGTVIDGRVLCIDCERPYGTGIGPCRADPIEQRAASQLGITRN